MKNNINIVIIQKKIDSTIEKNISIIENTIINKQLPKNSIVVLHELSLSKYFCISKNKNNFKYSITNDSPVLKKIEKICEKNKIFLIIGYFEEFKKKYYNACALISPKGIIGKYRKKNLPDEECYYEKFYFENGKQPFKVFDIGICKIGIMLCWDQWFSKSYSRLNDLGADIIFCPTSIGYAYSNNKKISLINEKEMWIKVIQSNSLMNNIPVIVANRMGKEIAGNKNIIFWGSSFMTNSDGQIIAKAGKTSMILKKTINLLDRKKSIKKWGFI